LVERLLHGEMAAQPAVAAGAYLNLGYLSGGSAAMRQFAENPRTALPEIARTGEDPWASRALDAILRLDDFGLVLIIASDAETGRAWIEQAGAAADGGFFMVTSAQAAPLLFPYLHSHPLTLNGLVSGLAGASYYERLRGGSGLAAHYWTAYSYSVGAALFLIIAGGLYARSIQSGAPSQAGTDGEPGNAA
jgi:hypothetical protein